MARDASSAAPSSPRRPSSISAPAGLSYGPSFPRPHDRSAHLTLPAWGVGDGDQDGVACEPCEDASGEDDVDVAEAAGLGEALKQFLAPVSPPSRPERSQLAARGTFAAPLDEAYSTCYMNVAPDDTAAADDDAKGSLTFALAPYGPGAGRTHIGKYQTKLTEPFWSAVVDAAGIELDLRKCRGDNAHHIVEATFKSFARCLRAVMDQMEGVDVVRDTISSTHPSSSSSSSSPAQPLRAASKARSTKERLSAWRLISTATRLLAPCPPA